LEKGIETRSFFIPMHRQPLFQGGALKARSFGPFPVADRLAEQGLYLPSGLTLSRDQIEMVCGRVRRLSLGH